MYKKCYRNITLHIQKCLVESRTEASDKSPSDYKGTSSLSLVFELRAHLSSNHKTLPLAIGLERKMTKKKKVS